MNMIQGEVNQLKVRAYKMEKRMHELEKRMHELEKRVKELEKKTASNLSQPVVAESETSEDQSDGYVPTVDDFFYTPEKDNSEKPNYQDFDMERALELVRDIESCTINNANSATKAILISCMDLRRMFEVSDE